MVLLRKNIPNMITLSRIAFSAVLIFFIYTVFYYSVMNIQGPVINVYLIMCFAAIIFSDVIDGHLARKMNLTTAVGAKLDHAADLIYVVGTIGILAYFDKVPAWFLLVLISSYVEFLITSRLLSRLSKSQSHVVFDKLGKTAANLTMLLPGVFIFRCMPLDYVFVMQICVITITALFLVSFVYRVIHIAKLLNKKWV